MEFTTTFLIAIGLAMDAFAVSLGIGTTRKASSLRPVFRLSFQLGLFQGGMTFLGWLAGTRIEPLIANVDHWIAFGLLVLIGSRMITSGLKSKPEEHKNDPFRGGMLLMLSLATSIDAFAVGLSLAMLHVEIWVPSLVIGLVTLILSLVGLFTGDRLGNLFGRRMEIIGGLILIAIGLRIVISHQFS